MQVLPCSSVSYMGESNSPNQGPEKAFGNVKVDNLVLNAEESDDKQFDDDVDDQELPGGDHGKWLEHDQPMAVWVKWRGKWQAGIRCARSDWPLSTVRAKPTHDRKQYLVIFFPRKRNYLWADVLLLRPINEFPEPIAYKSHNIGVKVVKELTLARRFIMQKIAVSMINTIEQLNTEALTETARSVVVWKDFASEASRCKDYSDLGNMLLKLKNMILQRFMDSYWLENSLETWMQQCRNAQSAESIELLKEELGDAIKWNEVYTLSNSSVQPEVGSEWKTLKPEIMKWFSTSNPSFNNGETGQQIENGFLNTGLLQVSRKRPKLEIRRAEVQVQPLRLEPAGSNQVGIDSRFFNGPSRGETLDDHTWGEIVVEAKNMQETAIKNKQCMAYIEAKGRRCVRWANDGDVYCCVHLGFRFSGNLVNSAEITPPPPTDTQMCEGTTVLGTKCKHRSLPGTSFCKKHRSNKGIDVISNSPPENNLKRKLEEPSQGLLDTNSCKEIVLSGHFEQSGDEPVHCVGGEVRCRFAPNKHTLYCEKHLPNWLKRARNGKSRIVSKEVFIDLLKSCESREKKLHLHQACELFYRFFRSVLSSRSLVPKEIQLQWVITEASKDVNTGRFLSKLVCSEKERLIRLWGFNNIEQNSSPVKEPVKLLMSNNVNFDIQDGLQKYICRFCGSKFDLLPDLGRHHQAAHMGLNPIGPRKRAVSFYPNKLKRLKKIRNFSSGSINKHVQTLFREVIEGESQSSESISLGRLRESECSDVAKLLYSKINKTKPRPVNLELLSIARSVCCKLSFQESMVKKYGILPERLYLKAAKLCSENNVLIEWHQEGFICPKGCKSITDSGHLPLLTSLSDGPVRPVKPVRTVSSEWVMDECHYIINFNPKQESCEKSIVLCDDISFGKESVQISCVVDEHLLGTLHNGESSSCFLPWESFTYITKPLIDKSLDLGLQSIQLGCGCAHSTCSPKACDHVYLFDIDYEDAKDINGKSMKGRFPYDDNGRIILEEGYLVYECNKNCSCNKDCPNRVLQNGVKVKLEVFKTEDKGWGIRAGEPIDRGTFVCEYIGEVIDDHEARKRSHRYGREGCSFIYEIDARVNDMIRVIEGEPSFSIDATKYGNVSRYINHSCSPNLENHQVLIESLDSELSHIGLYASRDIAAGEELGFDYMYKAPPGEAWICRCGAVNCRGRVR